MKKTITLFTTLMLGTPAISQELILGLGYADFADGATQTGLFDLGYKATPFKERGNWRFGFVATAAVTAEGDAFLGGGIYGEYRLAPRWFVEGSLTPGLYFENDSRTDLGHVVEFRSLLGLGYDLSESTSVSVAFTHKSNAGLGDLNPGANAVLLRYHRRF